MKYATKLNIAGSNFEKGYLCKTSKKWLTSKFSMKFKTLVAIAYLSSLGQIFQRIGSFDELNSRANRLMWTTKTK